LLSNFIGQNKVKEDIKVLFEENEDVSLEEILDIDMIVDQLKSNNEYLIN